MSSRSSLGMLSGRLRGGFLASTLPRCSNNVNSSTSSERSTTPPPSTSDSDDMGSIMTLSAELGSNDPSVRLAPTAILDILKTIKATTSRLDRRFHTLEQQQIKLADSIRELQSLMKNQEKDNFSIKGSTYEVKC